MSTYQISCTIGTTDPTAKLGLEVWLDDLPIFNLNHIDQEIPLTYDIQEDDGEHELRFVMKGKTSDDTIIDENNNILKDACITIKNVAFDEIELNQVFIDRAVYTHDFNGTQEITTTKFYTEMGCNGTVSLKFTTPVYLWLLENM